MSRFANLLDLWPADPDIAAALPGLHAYIAERCTGDLDPDEVDITHSGRPGGVPPISVLHCYSASAHVDLMHPRWTAILVVQARGHRLGVLDYRPARSVDANDHPPDTPRHEVALAPGQLILLDDHHTHWLRAAPDNSRFIGVNIDLDARADRAAIAARFRALLAAHGLLTA